MCQILVVKMSQFEPEEFFGTDVTCVRLAKLDKPKLWKLMEYLELEAPEDAKKPCRVYWLAVTLKRGSISNERERKRGSMRKFNLILKKLSLL